MNARDLKRGMTVPIYYDPLTRQRREGYATLVRQYPNGHAYIGDTWDVQFFDVDAIPEEMVVRRVVACDGA